MKKTLLTLLVLLGITQAVAQEYEYVPFVREGAKWVYFYTNYDYPFSPHNPNLALGKVYLTLEFRGDTVINGKTYKAMHKYYGNAINEENDTIPVYMREENKVVYGFVPNRKIYMDCLIGMGVSYNENIFDGEEFTLYDFNDPAAYLTEKLGWEYEDVPFYYSTVSIDTIATGNHMLRRFAIGAGDMPTPLFSIIEGIGYDIMEGMLEGYTLFPLRKMTIGSSVIFALSHVIENGEIIYKGFRYREEDFDGIGEVVADKTRRPLDANYYNLMGQPVGKDVPTVPGIYIHQGKKIVVR
jgi:hypothetical protein